MDPAINPLDGGILIEQSFIRDNDFIGFKRKSDF
jgi:hypothetical protein